MSNVAGVRKKRGTVLGSITRLANRLKHSTTFDLAQDLAKKLVDLDQEFRKQHSKLVDLIDEGEEDLLVKEQDIIDRHDDELAELNVRIKRLILVSSSSADSGHRRAISRRLSRLERSITTIHDELKTLAGSSDVCLIHQYEERLQALRTELGGTSDNLLDMEIEDSDDLCTSQSKLEKMTFDCALAIKRLLSSHPSSVTSGVVDGKGVKLPKLDAPTFDGKLIN